MRGNNKIFLAVACIACACLSAARADRVLLAPGAQVVRFAAALQDDGTVRVCWQTSMEIGTEAFGVRRRQDDGTAQLAGDGWVGARGDDAGGEYAIVDAPARAGDILRYDLMLRARGGSEACIASWSGAVARVVSSPSVGSRTAAAASSGHGALPLAPPVDRKCWIGSLPRVRDWTNGLAADRVRLSLFEDGIYRVPAGELASAMGVAATSIEAAIAATNLTLSCLGAPVAWYADGTNVLFYGQPPASHYAPENVYWIAVGSGTGMPVSTVALPVPAITNLAFADTVFLQGSNYAWYGSGTLCATNIPDTGFGLLAHYEGYRSISLTVPLAEVDAGSWTGTVAVSLVSLYELGTDDHTVRVSAGSAVLGTASWSGEKYSSFTFPFSSTNLTFGTVVVKTELVVPTPPRYNPVVFVSSAVTYRRRYRAPDGALLRCTGGDGNTVCAAGFATNDLLVLDVTEPACPVIVPPVEIAWAGDADGWQVVFPSGDSNRIYIVFSRSTGCRLPAVRGVRDVDWADSAHAADEIILTPPEAWRDGFRTALQPLADFRTAQGLQTRIVDVESIYNHYSSGLVDPLAIQSLARDGCNWSAHPLRYLLLAGAGSPDYKHRMLSVNSANACLIPTLIAGQQLLYPDGTPTGDGMVVALDNELGVVDGGDVPDVAVGRFPTTSLLDISNAVHKTMAYEGAMGWKQQASLIADWNNTYPKRYPFDAACNRLVDRLTAAGRTVVTHYAATYTDISVVRTNSLFPALAQGSGLLHYCGHGSESFLGPDPGEMFLVGAVNEPGDFTSARMPHPMIMIVAACRANRWQMILSSGRPLLSDGLFAANAGLAAAIGATSYMLATEADDLSFNLYDAAATDGTLRLGDVLCRGLRRMSGNMPRNNLLSFCLSGDPALVWRHDVTSVGTPTAWLAAHGLVDPNADFADPDADGWPTWREYAAGTAPTGNVLRLTGLRTATDRRAIDFEADGYGTYQLQEKASLAAADEWQSVPWAFTNAPGWSAATVPIVPDAPVTTVEFATPGGTTSCFFRVIRNP
ncbi:MAG: C25 family cysteine peptidase [bacterium]